LVFIETLLLVIVASLSIIFHGDEDDSLYYEAALCIFATAGFFYFASDAVYRENQFQLGVSIFVHMIILCYVVWHYKWPNLGYVFSQFALALVVTTTVFTAIFLLMFRNVADTFGWRAIRRVGASVDLNVLYSNAELFFSLIKLDILIGVLLLLLTSFYLLSAIEDYVTFSLAMAVTFGWAAMGVYAITRESGRVLWLFYGFWCLEPAYIGYKLWDIYTNTTSYKDVSFGQFLSTGLFAIAVRFGLIYAGHICHNNFGKGLLDVWLGHTRAQPVIVRGENGGSSFEGVETDTSQQEQLNNNNNQRMKLNEPLLPEQEPQPLFSEADQ